MLVSRIRSLLGLLLTALVVFSLSCASLGANSATQPGDTGSKPAVLQSGMPPLPVYDTPRNAAFTNTFLLDGANTYDRSANTAEDGFDLLLQPGPEEISYAIYQFDVYPWDVAAFDYDIQFDDAAKAWLGVANYSSMSWQFSAASSYPASLPGPTYEILSPGLHEYFAVIAYNDTEVRIHAAGAKIELPDWEAYNIQAGAPPNDFDLKLIGDRLYLFSMTNTGDLSLHWATAAEPTGTADWGGADVLHLGSTPCSLRLADVGGLPAVAFYLKDLGVVEYYHAKTPEPQSPSDWTMFTLDYALTEDLALAEIHGRPALLYFAEDVASTKWITLAYPTVDEPTLLDDWQFTNAVQYFPQMTIGYLALSDIDGKAACTYYDENTADYHYLRSTSDAPQGPADWTASVFADSSSPATYPFLHLYAGNPVVVYRDRSNYDLDIAVADKLSPTSTSDWTSYVIKHTREADCGFSSTLIGDGLGVALIEQTTDISPTWWLYYLWFDDSVPSDARSWKIVDMLDAEGIGDDDPHQGLALPCLPRVAASAGGLPHIAYLDYVDLTDTDIAIKIVHQVVE